MKSKAIVLAVVVVAVIGWMGLGATSLVGAAAPAHSAALPSAPAPAAVPSTTAAAPTEQSQIAQVTVGGSNVGEAMAEKALAATHAAGLKSNVVFVPRPSASPAQVAQAAATGTVAPLYTGVPAPIGLAYYGLSGTGSGAPIGTILNTTAVRGIVDANATGIQGMDLFQSSPDSYGIQLNSVMTNVTLFGTGGFSFWTQNVVEFYPTAGFMILVTNIWNFTGGGYTGNEFASHSLVGGAIDDFSIYGELGYYYAEYVVPAIISYPFQLTLTMNSGINGGQDNISFSVDLTSSATPGEDFALPNWDAITFNSTAVGDTPSLTVPSNYTANGLQYNPIGLTDDFELDICGPGGGSQVDLSAADATLGLAYLSEGSWVSVPAAYNYGGETGETATGANVAWSDAPDSPVGLADYGTMTTGPTELTGLWGTGAPEGSFAVHLAVTPSNAFNFLQFNGTKHVFYSPNVREPSYAPTMLTHTFYLMPGTWDVQTQLSDYDSQTIVVNVSGPMTINVNLGLNLSAGIYTPLWAFSNAQVANLAQSGAGTPSNPYILYNAQYSAIRGHYGIYNDYTFPVFPGVFLYNTTVSVEILNPPSFSTATSTFQFPGHNLPLFNDPQYWFWNVSNVALVDAANISGWFGASAFYPLDFDTFNVIFYEGGHNLVAGNTFDTESQGLLMFSGGTLFGPLNVYGGNNTVWGNTFVEVPAPSDCLAGCLGLFNEGFGLGMEIAESNDLIYNNAVETPTTAWLDPINLYSGDPEFFTGTVWNVTPQPASNVKTLSNFPTLPLSGSILGGSVQAGNYWWDYGVVFNPYNGADNPLGVLPYDENATTLIIDVYGPYYYYQSYIYPGGDQAPLVRTGVGPAVTFQEHGLLSGTSWGATVTVGPVVFGFETKAASETLSMFPAGKYAWGALSPAPVGYTPPHGGKIHLVTNPVTVTVAYHVATGYAILTVKESKLPSGTSWTFELTGTSPSTDPFGATKSTTGTSLEFLVIDGSYNYNVPYTANGWGAIPPGAGELAISHATTLHVRFGPILYPLVFSETGMTSGARWGVRITGPINGVSSSTKTFYTTTSTLTIPLPNGSYTYTVVPPAHTTCTPASGAQTILSMGAAVALTCTVSGGHEPAGNSSSSASLPTATPRAAVRGPSA